jgi:hypothetical protein
MDNDGGVMAVQQAMMTTVAALMLAVVLTFSGPPSMAAAPIAGSLTAIQALANAIR